MRRIRIGTRGSPLAMKQARMVVEALARVQPDIATDIVVIHTSGDWRPEQGEARLDADRGGKALFAREIEEALLAGTIDAAVHSMKDMESVLPEGLLIAAMLPRGDARDAMILREEYGDMKLLKDLPPGFTIGTCSLRREGFLKSLCPDLDVLPVRGNVHTRLQKLKEKKFDGIILAQAGLNRLGIEPEHDFLLEPEDMLPAAGQGAIGIEARSANTSLISIFGQINDEKTNNCVSCERAALAAIGASCDTPVGAYALAQNGQIFLRLRLVSPDGGESYSVEGGAVMQEGKALGLELGKRLKQEAPASLLKRTGI